MSMLLEIDGLNIAFPTRRGTVHAAKSVSLTVKAGEVLGLVGESGAGKSTIGNAIINLLEAPGRITAGSIRFMGEELRDLDVDQMRSVRGKRDWDDLSRSANVAESADDHRRTTG
jgi:peptide/nickel transport system ATP-binding protein